MSSWRRPKEAAPAGKPRQRRRLRKNAENEYGRPVRWAGGHLCFTDDGSRVPGSIELPKPGSVAIGWEACGAQIWPPVIPEVRSNVYGSSSGWRDSDNDRHRGHRGSDSHVYGRDSDVYGWNRY